MLLFPIYYKNWLQNWHRIRNEISAAASFNVDGAEEYNQLYITFILKLSLSL
jgi:hypothetical protein